MPRKAATTTAENTIQAIADAFDTPLNLDWDTTAENLMVSVPELQERMACKLDDTVFTWANIPAEHQSVVDAISRDLDAERSIRSFGEEREVIGELPPVVEEIPELPEEPQPKQRGGQLKKQSSSLTKKKSEKLKESDEKAQKLALSDQEVKVSLHARKGQKSGAQLATIELAAEDATYRQIKGQALVRKVGQLTSEIASESDFDPIQVLAELGIDSNSEIFEDLRQQIEPALGKLESATAEIVEKAWVNGIDLEVELGNLQNLMNSSEFTSDYWQ
jgi:hypothetical protein